jgi:hypothetical protein
MKRPAAPESGPNPKQRRTVSPPTNTHQEKSRIAADMEVLPDDTDTRALHRQHWQSIRTEEATGNRVQDRHNFTLHEMTESTFTEMVHRIFREQTTAFKINVSFGFILRHMKTGELRYYHSSQNKYLDELQGQDILEYIRKQRYDLGEDVYVIIKAHQLTIHIKKYFVPNGEWTLHPTKRGVTLSLYEWKELKKPYLYLKTESQN